MKGRWLWLRQGRSSAKNSGYPAKGENIRLKQMMLGWPTA